ncbi:MAG: hypothetical protein ACRCYO_12960 [Bacteroidia bacterium]
MKRSLDHLVIGAIAGMLVPIITLFAYYVFTYRSQTSFSGFVEYFTGRKIIVPVISLCCIANLLLFFLFIWSNRNQSARGVIIATMIYSLWVVYQKYIA